MNDDTDNSGDDTDAKSVDNAGYGVPPSPPARGKRSQQVIASAHQRPLAQGDQPRQGGAAQPGMANDARFRPVNPQYAHAQEMEGLMDDGEAVLDMMTSNVALLHVPEAADPDSFREFGSQIEYEAFMHEPVTIKIAQTRDKNEPPVIFVGVCGDMRWLPRDVPIRLQRKFVERLAQAQERQYETKDNPDPSADNMKRTIARNAASYAFAVIRDPNPMGPIWLRRIVRQGS